jgi:enolase
MTPHPTAIVELRARRVYDSRGRPTVEAEVGLAGGASGRAIAPAGASRGTREAVDLRDGGASFGGLDVRDAIANVAGPIKAALAGCDALDQAGVDARMIELDGTPTKSRLGGNALVAVSMAAAHAAAAARGMPLWRHLADGAPVSLPLPEIQLFGGGAHASRRLDLQDVMVMPVGARTFAEAAAMVAEIYRAAGGLMQASNRLAGVADEGGYWPLFAANEEALELAVRSIEAAGFAPGRDAALSLDVAASELYREGAYRLALDQRVLDAGAMLDLITGWVGRYPIASIEDPFDQDDTPAWIEFMRGAGGTLQVIGDDFLTTSAARVEAAARDAACNAVLVKPNQAGTLTEARAALEAARARGFATIVSARSGETEDVTIAHLAVGWNAGQLKVGSFARSERMAKWNEVLRIEESLGAEAVFAGAAALSGTGDARR